MWVGFSKSLGGGLSVGVGTRIGHKKRPTQADLEKAEKADFLARVKSDTRELIWKYLVANNINPDAPASLNLDIDQLLIKKGVDVSTFNSIVSEIGDSLQKVEYGGSLTAKRRESLVNCIFELRKIVPDIPSRMSELIDRFEKERKKLRGTLNPGRVNREFARLAAQIMQDEHDLDPNEITAQPSAETAISTRRVSVPLFFGVLLIPLIFFWFLLRKGHSTAARVIGFSWLAFFLTASAMSPDDSSNKTPPSQVQAPKDSPKDGNTSALRELVNP